MNILNYIAKDIKEGTALNDALASLQDQTWIVGDVARRLVTNSSPEDAETLDLLISCDEHAPTMEILRKEFPVESGAYEGYRMKVGPLPVSLRFADVGEYLATRRWAGECIAVHLTKKVPVAAPEFFFAPPTAEVGGQSLPVTPEQQNTLADLVIFEAHLAERMAQKVKENLNKSASEIITDQGNAPVQATD